MTDPGVEPSLRQRPPERALQWVLAAAGQGCELVRVTPLLGGTSHATHRIDLRGPRGQRSVVIRRWVRSGWRDENPDHSPSHEAETLTLLAGRGVKAPRLIAVDDNAAFADVPAVIATLVPGAAVHMTAANVDAVVGELAAAIAAVHDLNNASAQQTGARYARYYPVEQARIPPWSSADQLWQRAIKVAAMAPSGTNQAFIHRDYHPGNTLWLGARLSGILDWERAGGGPIAVDIAHMRLNLALGPCPEAAQRYTDAYTGITGRQIDDLAYWDIADAVDLMPDMTEAGRPQQRRLEEFIEHAIGRIEL